jgi:hypothetical protein
MLARIAAACVSEQMRLAVLWVRNKAIERWRALPHSKLRHSQLGE